MGENIKASRPQVWCADCSKLTQRAVYPTHGKGRKKNLRANGTRNKSFCGLPVLKGEDSKGGLAKTRNKYYKGGGGSLDGLIESL